MSDLNYSSANIFVIDGAKSNGKADVNSTVIVGSNSGLADVVDLKIGNTLQEDANRAQGSQFLQNITRLPDISGQALSGITDYSGYVALNLGAAATAGHVVTVLGDFPTGGSYYVKEAVGNLAVTDVPYKDCYVMSSGSTFYSGTATLDNSDLTSYVFSTDVCEVPAPVATGGAHKFTGYRMRQYGDCWECFTGEVDVCDLTVTSVTLWEDQAEDGPKVYFTEPCGVKEGNSDGTSAAVGTDNPVGENEI